MRGLTRPASFEPAPRDARRVLVIKLSALGDLVQALAPARMIREHHPHARITVLTTPPFRTLLEACPWFDEVETDGRPARTRDLLPLLTRLRAQRYDIVYDLQTSGRTNRYFHLMRPWPPLWCGMATGCAYLHDNPNRLSLHTLDRLAEQLWFAGVGPEGGFAIGHAPLPDVSWYRKPGAPNPRYEPATFGLEGRYALLIPGASAHRPEKRWPAARYGELARRLAASGITPVVIGAGPEAEAGAEIARAEPRAVNLVARTDLLQIIALAERAHVAIGNDTGPTHLAAAAGTRTLVLFSGASNPQLCAPRGRVTTFSAPTLESVPQVEVERTLGILGVFEPG
jgi:ADP-heptose:LPS heptosyltransferase